MFYDSRFDSRQTLLDHACDHALQRYKVLLDISANVASYEGQLKTICQTISEVRGNTSIAMEWRNSWEHAKTEKLQNMSYLEQCLAVSQFRSIYNLQLTKLQKQQKIKEAIAATQAALSAQNLANQLMKDIIQGHDHYQTTCAQIFQSSMGNKSAFGSIDQDDVIAVLNSLQKQYIHRLIQRNSTILTAIHSKLTLA